MPWDPKYRKQGVQGITANAIDVVIETGDSGPVTPIGINLPERSGDPRAATAASRCRCRTSTKRTTSRRCRRSAASSRGRRRKPSAARSGARCAGELTTNMHEVIGHASGKISERLAGNPQAALKEHFSALEEARADLVALYFLPDPKLVELGLVPAADQDDIVRTEYEAYSAQRARPAAPRPRGHADRRRPHAQPPDDRALADGEHQGDRGADARRQDLLRDGRCRRRSARASAGCSPKCSASRPRATTPRRRRCSRPTASTSIRSCATRWSRASTS